MCGAVPKMMDWKDTGVMEEKESMRATVLLTNEVKRREEESLSLGTRYHLWGCHFGETRRGVFKEEL